MNQTNVRKVKILFLDDNAAMHRVFKAFITYYGTAKQGTVFDVDYFSSSAQFYTERAPRYDVAVVDYNIGPALHDTGDNVLTNLNGSCPLKYILTGESPEIVGADGICQWCIDNDVILLYKQSFENLMITLIREFDRCLDVLERKGRLVSV